MNTYTRWKKCVVHLETATYPSSPSEADRDLYELYRQFRKGEIEMDEYLAEEQEYSLDLTVRFTGTSVFFVHEGRRYLLTARHILFDNKGAGFAVDEEENRFSEQEYRSLERYGKDASNDPFRAQMKQDSEKRIRFIQEQQIVPRIFRVLSWGELEQARLETGAITESNSYRKQVQVLTCLGGHPDMATYSFSDPATDLAIISLDHWDTAFGDGLLAAGYQPLSMDDIAEEPSGEGAELFSVGYPGDVAELHRFDSESGRDPWASNLVSLPVFAFGRVSMLHDSLSFFWCDLSVYPGNSGGPIVENDKLVGIISEQALTGFQGTVFGSGLDNSNLNVEGKIRIPFGKITKAKYIRALLERQIEKDTAYQKFHYPVQSPEADEILS